MNPTDDRKGDPVDEALAGGPYVADDGFTLRVLDALPPPRRRGRALVPLAALGAGAVGVALALGPAAGVLPSLAAWLAGAPAALGAVPFAALGGLAALAVAGLLVAFAD